MKIHRDGHVHTPFCPHGSLDSFKKYIERAIKENLSTITFTEHAPLPAGFEDPVPTKDSAMSLADLSAYVEEIETYKKEYRNDITILTGLEIDYIEGFEEETRAFLDQVGHLLDDSILSVHFLKTGNEYTCLDYSPESFQTLIKKTGSLEDTVNLYFKTVLLSIESNLGTHKPKRIGHITLVRKFHHEFPVVLDENKIMDLLDSLHERGMELDYNGAGTAKPLCREPYPPDHIVKEAKKRGIPLIYGSDAHQAKDMMQGLETMIPISRES
ncbi:histidinol-phosphatase HisJ [Bacillus piscicola]|uniref:histidinol-phosphatase HisJ n=1 Tax=Bacillus piscicola TaxID=1632684 RepID=UPI001F0975FD|nr:histidinol-phosphatase HisJ [Bacillus piscicola]